MGDPVDDDAIAEAVLARILAGEDAEQILKDYPPEIRAALTDVAPDAGAAKRLGNAAPLMAPTSSRPGNLMAARLGTLPTHAMPPKKK